MFVIVFSFSTWQMLPQTLHRVGLSKRICLSNTEPIGQKGYGRVFLLILLSSSIPPLYLYRMVRHRQNCLSLFVFYALRHIGYDTFGTTLSSYHPSSFLVYGRGGQSSAQYMRPYLSLGYGDKCDFQPHRTRNGYLLVSKSSLLSLSNS